MKKVAQEAGSPSRIVMSDSVEESALLESILADTAEVTASVGKLTQTVLDKYLQSKEGLEEIFRLAEQQFPELNAERIAAIAAHTKLKLIIQDNTVDNILNIEALLSDSGSTKVITDNIQIVESFVKNFKSLVLARESIMDSAFVNKAIGLAVMVLGALSTLLGALAMAVSLGAISTGVLAPVGVVGANASAGMMGGGVTTFAFGVGFFAHGRNITPKAAQEPLLESQVRTVAQD